MYTIEIYPIILNINELPTGIYHYIPNDNILEKLRGLSRKEVIDAALPPEREMLNGISAMICLSAVFKRHEYKYGEGGYRMMVAEAGHISENLILAATSLGIQARPFGGVFDDFINNIFRFNPNEEQFVLSVILGYASDYVSGILQDNNILGEELKL